jgi:hypothetical protein
MKKLCAIWFLLVVLALRADDIGKERKTLVLQGVPTAKALSAADPFPSLDGRPLDLRPESLPKGVRYKFADDASVLSAADLVTKHLLRTSRTEGPLFTDAVLVHAGAWKSLKTRVAPPKEMGPVITYLVSTGSKVLKLEMAFLRSKEEIMSLEQALVQIVKDDGGGRVRALKTSEMKKCSGFIGFYMLEPTLVLETKNGAHLFILDIGEDGLVGSVNELNGLPN